MGIVTWKSATASTFTLATPLCACPILITTGNLGAVTCDNHTRPLRHYRDHWAQPHSVRSHQNLYAVPLFQKVSKYEILCLYFLFIVQDTSLGNIQTINKLRSIIYINSWLLDYSTNAQMSKGSLIWFMSWLFCVDMSYGSIWLRTLHS